MNNDNKTILITGILGTVGIFTANTLLNENYNVIGIDNCSVNPLERINYIDHKNKNFKFYDNNKIQINDIFNQYNINTVLHLASLIGALDSMNRPLAYIENNIRFTTELLENVRKYKIKRFIFPSSSTVYGTNGGLFNKETDPTDPISVYGITKKSCEDLIKIYNDYYDIETIILRYYNIFANIKYFGYKTIVPLMVEKMMKNQKIILFNNGKQKRQYVPVQNIVYANKLAIETENKECFGNVFNITVDEEPISLLELVNYISEKAKKDIQYELNPLVKNGDIQICSGSNKKAKELLGFKIQKNMYDGIDEYIDWVINNANNYDT